MGANLKLNVHKKHTNKSSLKNKKSKVRGRKKDSCVNKTKSLSGNIQQLGVEHAIRKSLRIQNRNNTQNRNVFSIMKCISQRDTSVPIACTSIGTEIDKKLSEESVIYVKTTYYSASAQNIPTIDLTESNSSITSACHCSACATQSEKFSKDKQTSVNNSDIIPRSTSLLSLRSLPTGEVASIESMTSLDCNKKSAPNGAAEIVWELRKSYPLTADILQQSNIKSYLLDNRSRIGLKKHHSNKMLENKMNMAKIIPKRNSTSEPILHDDLKDINICPILNGALRDIDIDALTKFYNINEP